MRLYLDTNVYSFIQECGEAETCDDWLRDHGHLVLCSDNHLLETMPISDPEVRAERLRLLCRLAGSGGLRERRLRQDGDLHAAELLEALAEHRPEWLRFDDGTSEGWRRFARRRWQDICRSPERGMPEWENWAPVFDDAAKGWAGAQKAERAIVLDWPEGTICQWGNMTAPFGATPETSEELWRLDDASKWWSALKRPRETPGLRGLRDYTQRIRVGRIDQPGWETFWAESVRGPQMLRHRAVWMVGRIQLATKIKRTGNMWDAAHATYLVEADAFLTADHGFHTALARVADLMPGVGRPLLLDRGARSALDEIKRVLIEIER